MSRPAAIRGAAGGASILPSDFVNRTPSPTVPTGSAAVRPSVENSAVTGRPPSFWSTMSVGSLNSGMPFT